MIIKLTSLVNNKWKVLEKTVIIRPNIGHNVGLIFANNYLYIIDSSYRAERSLHVSTRSMTLFWL